MVYAPHVFPGRDPVLILISIAMILLHTLTGYIYANPKLILEALLAYLFVSTVIAIRILASYLYLRPYGLFQSWRIRVIMKGKPQLEAKFDGDTSLKQIMDWALAKVFTSSKNRVTENYSIHYGDKQLDPQLRLYQTKLPTKLTLTIRRKRRLAKL